MERKWGTRAAPIIVASETVHRAVVRGLSLYNCRHVYFIGVKFVAPWDHPLHLASCVNILVRRWVQGRGMGMLMGVAGAASSYRTAGRWPVDSLLPARPPVMGLPAQRHPTATFTRQSPNLQHSASPCRCKVLGECPGGWRMEAGCQVKEALKANQMTVSEAAGG